MNTDPWIILQILLLTILLGLSAFFSGSETALMGLGRIKRYTPKGKFLGLVGYVAVPRFRRPGPVAASCSNIAIAVSKDAARVYVQDVKRNLIRVLARMKGAARRVAA